MTINITISTDNATDAVQEVRTLAGALGMVLASTTAPVAAVEVPAEPAKASTAKPAGKGKDKTVAPPADPKPETQAQDTKDEAAETKAAETAKAAEAAEAGKSVAIDANSLRAAGKAYADKYGMPACLEDAPKIIGFPSFGKVPAEKVEEAYNAMTAAVEQNPFDRAEKTA